MFELFEAEALNLPMAIQIFVHLYYEGLKLLAMF